MTDKNQLQLAISVARRTKPSDELLDHIIKLYGDELEKANIEIAAERKNAELAAARAERSQIELKDQTRANDELFRIKQRTVVANRELMNRLIAAKKFCEAHRDDYNTMKSSESMDVDVDFILLCDAVFDGGTAVLDRFLAEEDLTHRFHNDARFHQFVEQMIAQALEVYAKHHHIEESPPRHTKD